jgi:uncharacterized protein (TIGR04255 family)
MPERRHYDRAPITEAIIDFGVAPRPDFSVEDLAGIRDYVLEDYPTEELEFLYSGGVEVPTPGKPAEYEGKHQHTGYRFTSPDKRQVFYARLNGFAFVLHAPYENWEAFRDEARRLWDVYRFFTEAEIVTRAAVRYINRIDIPATEHVALERYLRTYPEVSRDLPYEGLMSNFFLQVQLWQEDLGCMAVVNESPTAPPNEETLSILLDLDFFREKFEQPWRADEDAAVWEFMEQLHDRKNEVFEASITRRTRGLIE